MHSPRICWRSDNARACGSGLSAWSEAPVMVGYVGLRLNTQTELNVVILPDCAAPMRRWRMIVIDPQLPRTRPSTSSTRMPRTRRRTTLTMAANITSEAWQIRKRRRSWRTHSTSLCGDCASSAFRGSLTRFHARTWRCGRPMEPPRCSLTSADGASCSVKRKMPRIVVRAILSFIGRR